MKNTVKIMMILGIISTLLLGCGQASKKDPDNYVQPVEGTPAPITNDSQSD